MTDPNTMLAYVVEALCNPSLCYDALEVWPESTGFTELEGPARHAPSAIFMSAHALLGDLNDRERAALDEAAFVIEGDADESSDDNVETTIELLLGAFAARYGRPTNPIEVNDDDDE
jgi:hypothetical protein